LVRRLHGGGTGRRGTTPVSDHTMILIGGRGPKVRCVP
jgi:hypothetical protein